jgi:hypothetical protein
MPAGTQHLGSRHAVTSPVKVFRPCSESGLRANLLVYQPYMWIYDVSPDGRVLFNCMSQSAGRFMVWMNWRPADNEGARLGQIVKSKLIRYTATQGICVAVSTCPDSSLTSASRSSFQSSRGLGCCPCKRPTAECARDPRSEGPASGAFDLPDIRPTDQLVGQYSIPRSRF